MQCFCFKNLIVILRIFVKILETENTFRDDQEEVLGKTSDNETDDIEEVYVRKVCDHCGEATGKLTTDSSVQTEGKTPAKRGRKKKAPRKSTEPKRRSTRGLKQIVRYKPEPIDFDIEGLPLDDYDEEEADTSLNLPDEAADGETKPSEKPESSSQEGNENDEEVVDDEKVKEEGDDGDENKSGRSKTGGGSYLDFPLRSSGEFEHDEPVIIHTTKGRKKRCDLVGMVIPVKDVSKLMDEIMSKAEEVDGQMKICCTLCSYKTTTKRHLRPHIMRCHVPQTNSCPICNKKYSMIKDLRYHMKTHYPEHVCRLCKRRFPSKSILQLHHNRYHTEAKEKKRSQKGIMLKCDQCDYTNDQIKNLRDHKARHHMDKVFNCPRCDKCYALKKDLATHLKYHDASYTCEMCGKSLRSKMALKVHVNSIHYGIKNTYRKEHMCSDCGKICRSKTHYTEHINKEHLNHRPYGCPLCKMSFFSNASLRSHLKTHTTERRFTCDKCAKSFKHHTSLKMHQATHVDYHLRPFACSTCKKTFSQKGALHRHERIHTGECFCLCILSDVIYFVSC